MAMSFQGAHFPPEAILMGVRWYLAYPLSTRHVEALMLERGGARGSLDSEPVGDHIESATGGGVPPAQAPGMGALADGRNL